MTTDSLPVPASPPAAVGEESAVLNGVVEENLTLRVEVPVVSLQVDETICKNPEDTAEEVVWKVTDRVFEKGSDLVFTYRTPDGEEGSLSFADLDAFVWVDLGPVNK